MPLDISTPSDTFSGRPLIAGRYEILSRLGEGGMSEVWHAYDLKLRMDVALKSVRVDHERSEESMEALRREVRTAREVISPNVCRIFDLVVEQEQELISMEFINGITLMQLLVEKGPLLLTEARDIAAQFLAGLEAIHHAGLVHCDLKPENIMVTRAGRVVVMDFGIAKHVTLVATTISGTLPYMSPEQLSGGTVDARSDLFSAGVVLAEMMHSQRILSEKTREGIWNAIHEHPLQLQISPWKEVIARAVAPNPDDRFLSASALNRALEEATQHTGTMEERNPYPGLASFTIDDAENFFGRELEIETILKKLQQIPLIALIGPSGAGKTSLLRAGLIPKLPEGWSPVLCHPGDTPVANLVQAISDKDRGPAQQPGLSEDPDEALTMIRHFRNKHEEALLIVDRFEELFTLNSAETQARFCELIGHCVLDADIRVLLVMRDDFLIFCKEHPSLAPIFSDLTAMLPLSGAGLRRALAQPALKCGYRFEDQSLVDEILSDVEKERGALPLMSFAAAMLWEKRDRQYGELTRKAYKQIGGVGGALAQHAERTMDRIGTERLLIVREIFRNLITAQNTRAARDTEEFLSVFPDKNVAQEVLRTLIDARLLTSFEARNEDGRASKRRVEIIHESLLSAWPRLVRWQTQDADSAQLRDQLRQAAQLWDQRGRTEDLLWTGTAVLEFQAWRQNYPGGLTTNEEAFAQSMAQRANKKRRQRRLVLATIFVVLLGVLAVISSFWRKATVARDEAVSEARRAEAGKVLTLGRAIPEADPTTKLAYALAGLELADSTEGRRFALQSLSEGSPAQIIQMELRSIDFSPDGRWMAGSAAGGVYLFPRDGKPPITVSKPDSPRFYTKWNTQFSPDGEFLIFSWRKDLSIVKVWSLSQKKVIRTFDMEGSTLCLIRGEAAYLITDTSGRIDGDSGWDETVVRVWKFDRGEPEIVGGLKLGGIGWKDFDIDSRGRSIAYKKSRGVYIRSLDASGIGPEKFVGTHAAETEVVRFHPNGNEIASSDMTGEIRLWSLAPGIRNPVRVITGNGPRERIWFDPKGSFLLAPGDNALLRWDLSVPEAEPLAFRYQEERPRAVTFDKEGRWMAVAGPSTIAFYPLTHKYPYTFRGPKFSGNLRFTPDGKSLVNGESIIRMWNIFGEKQPVSRDLWTANRSSIESFEIDSAGKNLLIGTVGSGVHLISIADGKDLLLQGSPPSENYQGVAISPDGNFVAAARSGKPEDSWIEIWNLESGASRILEQSKGMSFYRIMYSPDGNSLFSGANGNLYQWNLKDNSHKVFHIGNRWMTSIAITNNGRYVAASSSTAPNIFELAHATSKLVLYDLKEEKLFPIVSHGNRVWSVTFDQSGTKLLTGDLDGIVRIGSISGDAPHLLIGHQGAIGTVLVQPGGKWIASIDDDRQTIRLWPMPEGKPFLTETHAEFLNRLRALTNVRAVANKSSSTGYRIDYSPFHGWETAPIW